MLLGNSGTAAEAGETMAKVVAVSPTTAPRASPARILRRRFKGWLIIRFAPYACCGGMGDRMSPPPRDVGLAYERSAILAKNCKLVLRPRSPCRVRPSTPTVLSFSTGSTHRLAHSTHEPDS